MLALKCVLFGVLVVVFWGCEGAPRPCPQFLPVAVTLDQQPPMSYNLKALIKVKNDNENLLFKDADLDNYVVAPSDLLLSADEATTKKAGGDKLKLLHLSELSSTSNTPEVRNQKQKKRRRIRPLRTKEPKTVIILDQNSNWALKTINDQPAKEVLMTDKASVARDLKDSTESTLVKVEKLEDQKQ